MKCKIGEFSKLGKVSVKTLRYYDSEGILKPAYTDRWNGYRYYAPEPLNDLMLIREYRAAGFGISEIRELLSDGDPGQHLSQLRGESRGTHFEDRRNNGENREHVIQL